MDLEFPLNVGIFLCILGYLNMNGFIGVDPGNPPLNTVMLIALSAQTPGKKHFSADQVCSIQLSMLQIGLMI